jgi:hypothetical protein
MEHLIKQHAQFSGEIVHLEKDFPHFLFNIHQINYLHKLNFYPELPVNIKTNRIEVSVGFFLLLNHIKNHQ